MQPLTHLDDFELRAPAKVNLFLEVLSKRPDGYHEIATLMVAIRLFDTLLFRDSRSPKGDITLHCSDPGLPTGKENLVVRAAELLRERTRCKRGSDIHLFKQIPTAAGLAGGSTDAAATFLGLNHVWKLGKSRERLAQWSGEIGSDIPFFFHTPAAWCTGRGEIVSSVELPIPLHFVLLCPSFGMSTAAVYKHVVVPAAPENGDAIRHALAKGDVDLLGRFMHNRLQMAAATLDPRIGELLQMLADLKPAGAMMSGSGSTLFALCRSGDEAKRIAAAVKTPDCEVIVTRSL